MAHFDYVDPEADQTEINHISNLQEIGDDVMNYINRLQEDCNQWHKNYDDAMKQVHVFSERLKQFINSR